MGARRKPELPDLEERRWNLCRKRDLHLAVVHLQSGRCRHRSCLRIYSQSKRFRGIVWLCQWVVLRGLDFPDLLHKMEDDRHMREKRARASQERRKMEKMREEREKSEASLD
ncbi:hypothetical protein ACLB2K_055445 [Fragaria x ananassa]